LNKAYVSKKSTVTIKKNENGIEYVLYAYIYAQKCRINAPHVGTLITSLFVSYTNIYAQHTAFGMQPVQLFCFPAMQFASASQQ
jgi:hypothetical protein